MTSQHRRSIVSLCLFAVLVLTLSTFRSPGTALAAPGDSFAEAIPIATSLPATLSDTALAFTNRYFSFNYTAGTHVTFKTIANAGDPYQSPFFDVYNSAEEFIGSSRFTQDSMSFHLTGQSSGTVYLRVSGSDVERAYTLTAAASTGLLGRVVLPDGDLYTGLGNVALQRLAPTPDNIWSSFQNDGTFLVDGTGLIVGGSYRLLVTPANSDLTPSFPIAVTYSGGLQSLGDLALTNPQLSGMVTAGGAPVLAIGYSLNFFPVVWTGEMLPGATIDMSGTFRIGGYPDGDYTLFAAPTESLTQDYVTSDHIPVTISGGQVTAYNGAPLSGPVTVALNPLQLRGYVTRADGVTPVEYPNVQVTTAGGAQIYGTSTVSGTFSVGGLADGDYTLRAMAANSYPSRSIPLTVSGGAVTSFDGEAYSPPVHLTLGAPQLLGRVVAPGGAPPPEGTVVNLEGPVYLGQLLDAEGRFSFGGLTDGVYTLRTSLPYGAAYSNAAPVTVTITGGLALPADVTLELLPFAGLTGIVHDPDGAPVSGVQLLAEPVNPDPGTAYGGAVTGEDGRFAISDLTGATLYRLTAQPPQGSAFSPALPVEVTYAGGAQDVGTLQLTRPQVRGEVRFRSAVVPYSYVQISTPGAQSSYGPPTAMQGTTTDSQGIFRIGALADGTYTLQAFPPWNMPAAPGEPVALVISGGVATTFGGQPYSAPVLLSLAEPQITGKVTTDDGQTPSQALVEVRAHGAVLRSASANGFDGAFGVYGLPDGTYELVAVPYQDYWLGPSLTPSRPVAVTIAGGVATPADVTLSLTQPQLLVRVLQPDGQINYGASVALYRDPSSPPVATASTYDGQWRFGGLAAGAYSVGLWQNYQSDYRDPGLIPVTIAASGAPAEATIQLAAAVKTIRGHLSDGSAPVADGYVSAYRIGGSGSASAIVDATGAYTLTVNAGGSWSVNIRPQQSDPARPAWLYEGLPQVATFSLAEDQPEAVTLDFVVTRANATVRGRLVDEQGSPYNSNIYGSAYVDVRDSSGRGQGTPVLDDGSFSLRVAPGSYSVHVYVSSPLYTLRGDPPIVQALADQSVDVGQITLQRRTLTISGQVLSTGTQAGLVSGVNVIAYRTDGGEYLTATTNGAGEYSFYVVNGVWQVQAMPDFDSSFRPGAARLVSVQGSSLSDIDLSVVTVDGLISGRIVGAGEGALRDLFGYASAQLSDGTYVAGAPLENGSFTLRVPTGKVYTVAVSMAPNTNLGVASGTADLTSTSLVELELPAESPTAAISGRLINPDGTAAHDVAAHIYAYAPGGYRDTLVAADGSFTLAVFPGAWSLGGWLDPESAQNYRLDVPEGTPISVTANQTVTLSAARNPVVMGLDGTITGTVTSAAGAPVAGAWVWAEQERGPGQPPQYVAGTATDPAGAYRLNVPRGSFTVRAGGMAGAGELPPAAVEVTVADAEVTVNLAFRTASAEITGVVELDGAPAAGAYVTAFAEDGAYAAGLAGSDGSFRLSISPSTTWRLRASLSQDGSLYRSDTRVIEVGASSPPSTTLTLVTTGINLPDGASITFSANTMQILTLSDGTRVTIPANALADGSGQVTVAALPKVELPAQTTSQPLSIGYALLAKDSRGRAIVDFRDAVTIVMPYPSDDVLRELGVDEQNLIPSYYDPATDTWRQVEGVTQDTEANTLTVRTTHFTDFAVMTATPAAPSYVSFLPIVRR